MISTCVGAGGCIFIDFCRSEAHSDVGRRVMYSVQQRVLNDLQSTMLFRRHLIQLLPRPLPRPLPPSVTPVSKLSLLLSLPVFRLSSFLSEERGLGKGRAGFRRKSYDAEKAWPSLHHSILSAAQYIYKCRPIGIYIEGRVPCRFLTAPSPLPPPPDMISM